MQATIALLTLGPKTRFFFLFFFTLTNQLTMQMFAQGMWLVDTNWWFLRAGPGLAPLNAPQKAALQTLRNQLGSSLSMQSTFVLLLRAAPSSQNSRTFTKGNKEHPKLHPRRLGSAWKRLSSKNNIVTVEAVETDFLRLISAFPPQHIFLQPSPKQNPNGVMKDVRLLKSLMPIFVANSPSGMFKCVNHGREY